jgi:uncharacterized protein (DUF1015 family)
MVSIVPVPRALIPVDSAAAAQVGAPNYDEFQGDHEIFDLLQHRPQCVLRITMSHCAVADFDSRPKEGSPEALQLARVNMQAYLDSPLTRTLHDLLWVYEIVSPRRPEVRQMGLGGLARTAEIRTPLQPDGVIIRNEGIRQEKADGRARLIEATHAYIGTVNCAVRDRDGTLCGMLEQLADQKAPDFSTGDESGNHHRVWCVRDPATVARLTERLAQEPFAYVADGNHRSAAAASLGREHFLAVFFTTDRMRLEPYNRLVAASELRRDEFLRRAGESFEVTPLGPRHGYRPPAIHEIGLYTAGLWYRLTPRPGTFDPANAVESIDSDIIQRHLFDRVLGIADSRDERLNFVGGNKDATYLQQQVDAGAYACAISLAPVTMEQFIAVCEQGRFMPPKSTWFDPKIRSGLVTALLHPDRHPPRAGIAS